MRFIYLPCEQYASRWTEFVSGSDGVVETLLKRYKIDYLAIRPAIPMKDLQTGIVLDTVGRTEWATAQVTQLVRMFFAGEIEQDDVIYFEDFWHPGFEMVRYAMDMTGINKPEIYSFCHAQSVDPHDFTAKMAPWMRAFEKAWAKCNRRIFTAAPELVTMLDEADVKPSYYAGNIAVGTIFDRSTLLRYAMVDDKYEPRKETRQKRVLFTSRWDKEKNPQFFLNLMQEMVKEDPKIEFAVCTGLKELKSNENFLECQIQNMTRDYPDNFKVYAGLSKTDYYHLLRTSTVQFNCADQDFVSYTLLEAAVFGCQPLYPYYLTFPAAMNYRSDYLYRKGDLVSAKEKLRNLLKNTNGFDGEFIYGKYQSSFARMLKEMGYQVGDAEKTLVEILKR